MAKSAKHASIAVLVSMLVCLAAPNSAAQVVGQVATGTPAFGSFGGGPFDTVNLGNLNVHFTVPMINKAGRGTTFNYNMAYDSSVWAPVTQRTWTGARVAHRLAKQRDKRAIQTPISQYGSILSPVFVIGLESAIHFLFRLITVRGAMTQPQPAKRLRTAPDTRFMLPVTPHMLRLVRERWLVLPSTHRPERPRLQIQTEIKSR